MDGNQEPSPLRNGATHVGVKIMMSIFWLLYDLIVGSLLGAFMITIVVGGAVSRNNLPALALIGAPFGFVYFFVHHMKEIWGKKIDGATKKPLSRGAARSRAERKPDS